ncbi:hypothetical protein [Streptomyces sp. NPDC048825]|uniref:hypothetical protein n=1 Tax=Streptomyces sp. NPDC048825 TaxID=3365592 RepID=UPI00371D6F3D
MSGAVALQAEHPQHPDQPVRVDGHALDAALGVGQVEAARIKVLRAMWPKRLAGMKKCVSERWRE